MKYRNIVKGVFIERPNRFVAYVDICGKREKVHVKNTGRCKELLLPGVTVYLEDFYGRMGSRKLRYSLIAVEKITTEGYATDSVRTLKRRISGEIVKDEYEISSDEFSKEDLKKVLINMDSQAPNKVVEEALISGNLRLSGLGGYVEIKREKKLGDSRFDFYVRDDMGREAFIEVKGVTLEENGVVKFPDAPTERGLKHVRGLTELAKNGFQTYVILVVQMNDALFFTPNYRTHREFGTALEKAGETGVHVLAYTCDVYPDEISLKERIEVVFQ